MKTYINPYKQFNGVFIPDWLLESDICSVNAKVMYALLTRYAGKDGFCYPKQSTLADRLGTSRRSVINYLKELQDCELIERKRTKGNNNYFFLEHNLMKQSEKFAHTKVQDVAHTDVKDSAHTYKESHSKESHSNTISVITLVNDVPSASDSNTWESAIRVANRLLETIQQWDNTHRYNSNPPSIESWVKDIDRAIRLDGRTEEQLNWIIDFLFTKNHRISNFWASNIQSGKKLREQFDKIKNQIKSEKYGTKKPIQQSIAETEDFLNRYSGQQGT